MSSSARIDELHRKFDENPRRFFAPLANEYRKAGELEQAIALCRAHLPHQAGHISGHIVLAQALFDAGERDESREVFHQALELDPENLIALRYLGDIARDRGDLADARHWYQRVLEVDPRNEEMAELTRQVEREQAAARAVRAPTPMSVPAAEREEPRAPTVEMPAQQERAASGAYAFGDLDIAPSRSPYADDMGVREPDARPDLGRPATTEDGMPAALEWAPLPEEGQAESLWPPARAAEEPQTPDASADPFNAPGASAEDLLREIGGADADSSDRARFTTPSAGREPQLLDLGDLEAAADPFLDDWINPPTEPARDADPFAAGGYAPTPDADRLPSGGDLMLEGVEAEEAREAPAAEFEELSLDVATHPAEEDAEPALAEHDVVIDEAPFADASTTSQAPVELEPPVEMAAPPELELPDEPMPPAPVNESMAEADGWRESAGSLDDDASAEPAPAESAPAAFVTETMAELYLQQGFVQEALDVYRRLLAQRPDDAGLRERIEMLESAPPVRAEPEEEPAHASWSEAMPEPSIEGPTTAEEPEPVFSGPLARDFFASLAARRPAGAEPTGAESAWVEPEHAVHAASRAPGRASSEAATSGASTAIADDDIEAFNAWLEGLRKP
jgi:tetratricopeptide (TPR) repeat protein